MKSGNVLKFPFFPFKLKTWLMWKFSKEPKQPFKRVVSTISIKQFYTQQTTAKFPSKLHKTYIKHFLPKIVQIAEEHQLKTPYTYPFPWDSEP